MSYAKSSEKKERHLSLDEVQYFERALNTLTEIKDLQEAENFFQQINDDLRKKEILIAKHKTCSRFLDEYIKRCPNDCLEKLFRAFSSHFEELSTDTYASHNVENLIDQTVQRLDSSDQDSLFIEYLKSFLSELTPVAATLADDPSGSHVARCIFNSLSIVPELTKKIDDFARKIIQSFVKNKSKMRSTYFSATVQSISSLDQERFEKLLKYLVSSVSFKFEDLSDKCTSKLIEPLIINMGKSAITAIYEQTFTNRENLPANSLGGAVDCAFNQYANYVLQKWLEFCKNSEQLDVVIKQLMPKIETLLARRVQVVVSISRGIILTNHKLQEKFYKILLKQTNNEATNLNFIEYFVYFKPPNGSKILQNMCYFDKELTNSLVVEPLIKLGKDKVTEIALDLNGSYFISDFLKSENIDLKKRKKIIRMLIPKIGTLSTNSNGRHVVENAFNLADIQLKVEICEAIRKAAYGSDSSTTSIASFKEKAKIIWENLRLDQFISRNEIWLKDTENIMKRHEAMDDIINDESIPDVKPLAPKIVNVEEEIAAAIQTPEGKRAAEEIEQIGSIQKRRKKHRHHHQDADPNTEQTNE